MEAAGFGHDNGPATETGLRCLIKRFRGRHSVVMVQLVTLANPTAEQIVRFDSEGHSVLGKK
jgi:hypothetical protein